MMSEQNIKKRIAIFCFYDPEGMVRPDTVFLAKELRRISEKLIIVVNGQLNSREEISFADRIIVRENMGYDIGAYKTAVCNPQINAMIRGADELVLCNNSFYGPFVPMEEIFASAEKRDWDIWGISKNITGINNHIQSYFIVYRKPVIHSECFYDYFNRIDGTKGDHKTSCAVFENGFINYLSRNGFTWGALHNLSCNNISNSYGSLRIDQLPILKKKAFECMNSKQNHSALLSLAYIEIKKFYDITFILNDVMQRYGYMIDKKRIHTEDFVEPQKDDFSLANANSIRLEEFINAHNKIYIYGCGEIGSKVYSRYFMYTENERKMAGFIVSDDRYGEEGSYLDQTIYRFSDVKDENPAIIVALSSKNLYMISNALKSVKDVFFVAGNQSKTDALAKRMANTVLKQCKNGEIPVIRGFKKGGKIVIALLRKEGIDYVINDGDTAFYDVCFPELGTVRSNEWIKANIEKPAFFVTSNYWFHEISEELSAEFPGSPVINIGEILLEEDRKESSEIREEIARKNLKDFFRGNDKWFDGRKLLDSASSKTIAQYKELEEIQEWLLNFYTPNRIKTGNYGVTICGIFKNEAPYLKEWLDYHLNIGVSHFYLYNNNSDDHYREVLASYIESETVTLLDWPKNQAQLEAYEDCIRKHRDECEWMGFIDIDEFVVVKDGTGIDKFLKPFKANRPSVVLYWKIFGSNGYNERDLAVPVIEAFHACCPYFNTNGKCFYNTSYFFDRKLCKDGSFHHRLYARNCEDGGIALPPVNIFNHAAYREWNLVDDLDFSAWINHYALKSKQEYIQKMNKSDVMFKVNKHDLNHFDYYDKLCTAVDYTISKQR